MAACALLGGCPSIPDSYAPPQQRNPLPTDKPKVRKSVLEMSDPDASLQILGDIYPEVHQDTWRWTGKRPNVALGPPAQRTGVKLVVDLATTGETLRDTGPVTIRFALNGHELGSKEYAEAGTFQFSVPVPPDAVHTDSDNELLMEIDKTFTSAQHPKPLGFILVRAGLVR